MEERNYKATVTSATKELTGKQKVALKNFAEAIQLDDATKEAPVIIDVDYVAEVAVHNEKAEENKNYYKYVFVAKDGTMYVSGSLSLKHAYQDLCEDMEDSDEEWQIKVLRKPSSNYKGKEFLTCVIV